MGAEATLYPENYLYKHFGPWFFEGKCPLKGTGGPQTHTPRASVLDLAHEDAHLISGNRFPSLAVLPLPLLQCNLSPLSGYYFCH